MLSALLLASVLAGALLAAVKALPRAGAGLAATGFASAIAMTLYAVLGAPSLTWAAVLIFFALTVVFKTAALGREPADSVPWLRGTAYLLLYPGLDPRRAFVADPSPRRAAALLQLAVGAGEIAVAYGLVQVGRRFGVFAFGTFPAAWLRIVYLVFFMDGVARAVASLHRAFGAQCEDVFDAPWLAADLSDFWGRRWNKFVSRTLFHEVFQPLRRPIGAATATLAVFAVSGLLHEVIFVLPTGLSAGSYFAFFGVQGVATIASSRWVPRGAPRRVFLWIVMFASAPLFFCAAYRAVLP